MGIRVWYTIGMLRDTQMPKNLTLHSNIKYITGDESCGVKVVSQQDK